MVQKLCTRKPLKAYRHHQASLVQPQYIMKFHPDAAVRPYPFVGVVARGMPRVLINTIDALVKDPGNVTESEAMQFWAVNSKAFGDLKSRSSTDVSELAYKLHCGEVSRLLSKVGTEVSQKWNVAAEVAEAAGIESDLEEIEKTCSEREIRRTCLQYSLFQEGLKVDEPGSVRTAIAYRSGLMIHKLSKRFIDSGDTLTGEATDAVSVAARVASAKKIPSKRPRQAPAASHKDTVSVRHALLTQLMAQAGLKPNDDAAEREFIDNGPNAVASMMNDIHSVIDGKRRKLNDEERMHQ